MEQDLTLKRREFSERALLLLLSGLSVTITACGGGGGGGGASAGGIDPLYGGPSSLPASTGPTRQGSISDNHGHVAIVTAAEFDSIGGVTLDIRGSATHPHLLELTRDELDTIAAGTPLAKQCSVQDGHAHTVSFDQAPPIAAR